MRWNARKMKVLKHFDAPVKSLTVIEKISGLLGDTGGKETSIFCALNDTYTKSWKDRELGKLGWKQDPNNDKLGRGHRKSARRNDELLVWEVFSCVGSLELCLPL